MKHLWRKDEIIKERLTNDQIISFYMGTPISLRRKYNSPFREDPLPSLAFYEMKGEVMWTDFGLKINIPRDGIGFVMVLFSESYNDAIERIYNDIICKKITPPKANIEQKRSVVPDVLIRNHFTSSEKRYWAKYHIDTHDLLKENIYAMVKMSYGDKVLYSSSAESPKFYYHFGKESFKIYMPLDRVDRFRSFNIYNVIERYDTLPRNGKSLIITSSTKDALVIKKIGVPAIAPTGETTLVPVLSRYAELSSRFERIYIMLDNDMTGMNSSQYLEAYSNWRWKILPFSGAKDPSDLVCARGMNYLYNQIRIAI